MGPLYASRECENRRIGRIALDHRGSEEHTDTGYRRADLLRDMTPDVVPVA